MTMRMQQNDGDVTWAATLHSVWISLGEQLAVESGFCNAEHQEACGAASVLWQINYPHYTELKGLVQVDGLSLSALSLIATFYACF